MNDKANTSTAQNIGRIGLGVMLAGAGIGHLTWARTEFLAQVPKWVPLNGDLVVVLSGIAEISLGLALLVLPGQRTRVGWVVATFFVLVFPGNISQFLTHTDAFGLNSDLARGIRLLFQPVLVIWALWSTGAWADWRKK
ncbi:DoxX family protein [Pedobacter metabolipauper]|uniref:Putative membrane protein n=1 Tax=Pedobacter metabolipauper TaxID=425513 RepID=A0A4R6T0G8_9SPHI|nr:DoxX family membrane protein [Pedobacter metabolipauper]TDQ11855.1 putative membrane protein [Pedobacter metabolipauper]